MAILSKMMFLLPAYLFCTAVYAQNITLIESGNALAGKVMSLGADSVVFRYLSDASGGAAAVPRQEVARVKRIETTIALSAPEVGFDQEALALRERQELILQARLDARAYYKGKGVFWTTMGSTILSPLAGLATGSVIAAVQPNVISDQNPNRHLQKDPVYQEAYKAQAHRRKVGKAAAGFGAGVAIVGVLAALAANMGGL